MREDPPSALLDENAADVAAARAECAADRRVQVPDLAAMVGLDPADGGELAPVAPGDDFAGYANGAWAKATPIPPDVRDRILDAGRVSGSSRNTQKWEFVVVSGAAQERLAAAVYAPENVRQDGQCEFDQEQKAQPVQEAALQPLLECLGLVRRLPSGLFATGGFGLVFLHLG